VIELLRERNGKRMSQAIVLLETPLVVEDDNTEKHAK
jgi:hypothetical protein